MAQRFDRRREILAPVRVAALKQPREGAELHFGGVVENSPTACSRFSGVQRWGPCAGSALIQLSARPWTPCVSKASHKNAMLFASFPVLRLQMWKSFAMIPLQPKATVCPNRYEEDRSLNDRHYHSILLPSADCLARQSSRVYRAILPSIRRHTFAFARLLVPLC